MKVLILLGLIFPFSGQAAEMKSGLIKPCGVQLLVPNSWTPKDAKAVKLPVCFEMSAGLNQASVIVMRTSEGKLSCADFLKGMEGSQQQTNLLSPEKRVIKAEQAKKAGADEGSLGEYEITGKNLKTPVRQLKYCFKKGQELRVLTATFQKEKRTQLVPVIETIFLSFQFSE